MFNEKFWLAISFIIFATIFVKYVLPVIAKMINGSVKKIADDIEAAKNLKEKAEELLVAAKKHYEETVINCKKLTIDAEEEAKNLITKSQAILDHELKIKLDAAVTRIKNQEEKIVRDLKDKMVDDAITLVRNNLANDLDRQKNDQLINQKIMSI